MQSLEEFRLLNARVKDGVATEEELKRWNELKRVLIQATQAETPIEVKPIATSA